MNRNMTGRGLSALFALALFFFLITLSISLPIYIRPFYYLHIEAMDMPERTGVSAGEIRAAYDAVLDYLTVPGREFHTGVFPFSQEGKAHFEDCKVLFDLNRNVLLASGLCLVLLLVLHKLGKTGPYRIGKRSAAFWGAALAVVVPVVLGALAAVDFDRAFVIFHRIFFPGKDNWILYANVDGIIRVLPQDFFMHCAMLIGGGLLVLSLGILIWDGCKRK